MFQFQRFQDLLDRLSGYSPLEVALEFALIWVVVYVALRFVQGTRAAGALKGLLFLLIVATILARLFGSAGTFQRVGYLYDRFLALVAIALIVIFQPELRRALVRLGETSLFRSTPKDISIMVTEVVEAATYLSRAKFGALIVIERSVALAGIVEGGTTLNAELSARLLQTLFFPGSALHDLAVVIKGRRLVAAGVQLPLAEPGEMPDPSFGSRHRAAIGLSKECDALVVIVSEERGHIRIAERGKLSSPLSGDELQIELLKRLKATAPKPVATQDGTLTPVVVDGVAEHDPLGGSSVAGAVENQASLSGSTGFGSGSMSGESVAGVNAFSAESGESVAGKKVV
ncbi:MAG: diadenylate cyclase CdaA [Planctomycetes bacterium]|nr:diadenylate cyclase CdaA [Planctomycetota bacterium]